MAGTGSSKAVDPIAYRVEEQGPITETTQNWGFEPDKLKNADVNLSKYGDDSSEANYNNPNLWGGENDKYTGENTRNTSVAYDENATLENLNPNYAYGQKAQMVNSSDAGYIQRRNDQIASALYNAGKVSIQDVSDYLNQQEGFQNSTENERNNTIASVWKRLGEISSNRSQNENNEDTNTGVENNEAVNKMESDLLQGTGGKIYGKNTADINGEDSAIRTLQDTYNVERAVNQQRIKNMQTLQSMSSDSIAASYVAAGVYPGGEQAMRDLMQYDSAKYNEVQQKIKEMKAQININSITQDGVTDESGIIDQEIKGQDTDLETWAKNNSDSSGSYQSLIEELQGKIDTNNTAKTAREQMSDLSNQIKEVQQKMKNLKKDAPKMFKSDVPQYVVNAYIANKTLEYQDKIESLNGQLQTAAAMRSNEIEEIKLQMSMEQFELSKQNQIFNQWATKQNLNLSFAKFQNDKLMNSLIKNDDGTYSQIQFDDDGKAYFSNIGGVSLDGEIYGDSDNEILQGLAMFCSENQLGSNGGQCGTFVNNYLQSLGLGRLFGSNIEDKTKVMNRDNSYTPQVGDIVVMDSPTKPQYGHVAIVTAVNGNEITTIESNKTGAGEVFSRTFVPSKSQYNSNYVYGYYHPEIKGSVGLGGEWTRKDGTSFDLNVPQYTSLSSDDKDTVKGLLNLGVNPSDLSTRMGYNKGQAQKLINAAMAINPDWTSDGYKIAQTTKQDWTKSSKNGSNSRNATAVQTAKELYDIADIIGNQKFTTYNDLMNFIRRKTSNEDFIRLNTNMGLLVSEYAGALKGNASPTDQDKQDAKDTIALNFSNGGMKTAVKEIARALYNKNVTEAQNYFDYTYTRPKVPYITQDIVDWMQNEVDVDLASYYDMGDKVNNDPFDSLDS